MHGTSLSPAASAARQRLSPAMIIHLPLSREGFTRSGSKMPFSLIEAVSSVKSPMSVRGCSGFGSILSIAISRPICVGRCLSNSSTKCESWRICNPVGNPLLDTAQYLFTKFCILQGAGRLRRKGKNGLFVGRRLFKPDTLGNHCFKQLWSKDALNLLVYFASQSRSLVVKRYEHSEQLQIWIWPGFYFLDRFQKIVGAFQREVR